MQIAVDKKTIGAVKNKKDYVYLFDNETYEELIKLDMHCVNYKYCNFVDINLTDYDIECCKKASFLAPPLYLFCFNCNILKLFHVTLELKLRKKGKGRGRKEGGREGRRELTHRMYILF